MRQPTDLSNQRELYRRALWPASPALPGDHGAQLHQLPVQGEASFLELVQAQGLAPLWHHRLQTSGLPLPTPDVWHPTRMAAMAAYLAQTAALARIDHLFEQAHLPYLVMKGGHVRECVYPEPSLRSASDLDLLVAPQNRLRAAQILLQAGYTSHVDPVNISHEAGFSRAGVDVDLHWNLLRPGRTRVDMTADLLARRQRVAGFWGLSDTDTVFLMLTHPAFTKYVCSPNMGLARVADFFLWVQHRAVDWPGVVRLLDAAGLKTAAWILLSWFQLLAPASLAPTLAAWRASVAPGRIRAAYLLLWLHHDLPTRWLERPLRIQLGLTLFLHDRPSDALRAWQGWRQARQNRHRDAASFALAMQSAAP